MHAEASQLTRFVLRGSRFCRTFSSHEYVSVHGHSVYLLDSLIKSALDADRSTAERFCVASKALQQPNLLRGGAESRPSRREARSVRWDRYL